MRYLTLTAVLLTTALAAHADTVYTSQSAFNAATTGVTTITFDGIAPSGSFVNEGSSFSIGAASFSANGGQSIQVTSPNYYPVTFPGPGYATYNSGDYLTLNGSQSTNVLTITVPNSTAVGFDFGGIFGPGTATYLLSDGITGVLNASDAITTTGSTDFFGFTSASPITSIMLTFDNTGNNGAVDNVQFGTGVTPEPSSFVFLLTGVPAVLATALRRVAHT